MTKQLFEIDGTTYEWVGCLGTVLKSREKGYKNGDVKVIADTLFYVYSIDKPYWFSKPFVKWSMFDTNIDMDKIRLFHQKLVSY